MVTERHFIMREIKFRAWLPDFKKMETSLFGLRSDGQISFNSNAALMQYTGLKDKNGKEIYEGDVVKLLSWHLSEISYRDAGFKIKNSNGDINQFMNAIAKHSEVIGNIYENPDLLNEVA